MTPKKKATDKPSIVIRDNKFFSSGPTPEAVAAARLIAEGCLATAQAPRHAAETLNVRAPGLVIGD